MRPPTRGRHIRRDVPRQGTGIDPRWALGQFAIGLALPVFALGIMVSSMFILILLAGAIRSI